MRLALRLWRRCRWRRCLRWRRRHRPSGALNRPRSTSARGPIQWTSLLRGNPPESGHRQRAVLGIGLDLTRTLRRRRPTRTGVHLHRHPIAAADRQRDGNTQPHTARFSWPHLTRLEQAARQRDGCDRSRNRHGLVAGGSGVPSAVRRNGQRCRRPHSAGVWAGSLRSVNLTVTNSSWPLRSICRTSSLSALASSTSTRRPSTLLTAKLFTA